MKATRTCSIVDCDRPHLARGWCRRHYSKWRRIGDPTAKTRYGPAPLGRLCSIEGCERPHKARGLCAPHYKEATASPRPARPDVTERFWSKVDRRGPDECWPWTGARSFGYGVMTVGSRLDGTRHMVRATHISLDLDGRTLGPGQVARHACDNPPCVNPAHLAPGTPADNSRDMHERNRAAIGSRAPWSLLTEAQVVEIRRLAGSGLTQREIAARYAVSRGTISAVVRRRNWRHVQ